MKRKILLPIDALLAMLVDYTKLEGSIPDDAMPISLAINRNEKGMFGIVVESPQFKDDSPLRVNFDIKRVYGIV